MLLLRLFDDGLELFVLWLIIVDFRWGVVLIAGVFRLYVWRLVCSVGGFGLLAALAFAFRLFALLLFGCACLFCDLVVVGCGWLLLGGCVFVLCLFAVWVSCLVIMCVYDCFCLLDWCCACGC